MIAIQLDQSPPHYDSGEVITGKLLWNDLPASCTSIELRLFWSTNGKGDRDQEVVASCRLTYPGPNGEQRFEFNSPLAPYSFSGKLISIGWELEAVPFPNGDRHTVELVIGPNRAEIQTTRSSETLS